MTLETPERKQHGAARPLPAQAAAPGAGEEPAETAAGPGAGSLGRRRRLRNALLILADLLTLLLAGALAYGIWAYPVHGQSPWLYLGLTPLLALFCLGYAQAGLYPGFGLGPVETLRRCSLVTSYGFLVLAGFSFALKLPHLYSRVTFVIAFVLALLLLPLARLAVGSLAGRWAWWREPVLLVGPVDRGREVIRQLNRSPHLGYRPVALCAPEGAAPAEVAGVPVVTGDPAQLRQKGLRVAFLLQEELASERLDRLHHRFRHIVLIRPYRGLPVEGIQVRNLGRLLGIEYTSNLLVVRNRLVKRTLDLTLGTVLLVLSLPVMVAAALSVVLVDPGSPFFSQRRAGLGGRNIPVRKVRTMYRDAEARLEEHLERDLELRRQWERRMKLDCDPRVLPRVGPFLRRFSLDELPQLWSVVKGDMSLVGPRPFPAYHLDLFSEEFRTLRQRVRPGITGLWQVTVRSEGGIEEQEAYDSYYIRNWSLWLDLYILGRTLGAVVRGKGAY